MATQYATLPDLVTYGIAERALAAFTDDIKTAALQRASEEADGYLGNVHTLPLATWGRDLRARVVDIAVYHLLSKRGFNPDELKDAIVMKRYDDAVRWLEKIAKGDAVLLSPDGVDATPTTYEGGGFLVTRAKRGWGG